MKKHYFFVAGYDYLKSGVNFIRFCKSRMRKIYAFKKNKEDLVFFICDFASGKITKHIIEFQNGRPFIKDDIYLEFDSISIQKNYYIFPDKPDRFYRGNTNTLNIIA